MSTRLERSVLQNAKFEYLRGGVLQINHITFEKDAYSMDVCRLTVCDGLTITTDVILSSNLHHLVWNYQLRILDVIRVNSTACRFWKPNRLQVEILDLTVLEHYESQSENENLSSPVQEDQSFNDATISPIGCLTSLVLFPFTMALKIVSVDSLTSRDSPLPGYRYQLTATDLTKMRSVVFLSPHMELLVDSGAVKPLDYADVSEVACFPAPGENGHEMRFVILKMSVLEKPSTRTS